MNDMDVVILCGGMGTRLKNVVSDRPKPMAEINGRPFLDILIEYMMSFGLQRFILCAGYKADFIKQYYYKREPKIEIVLSVEEVPMGTGGAIKNAEYLIQTSNFIVMNGDSFCPFDMLGFLDFHLGKGAVVSIVVVESEDTKDFGLISLDNSQKIIRFNEKTGKDENSFINAGIYLFKKEIFSLIPSNRSYSLEYDLFPELVKREFYGFITHEKLIDIGTPERYEQAKRNLR
jgi:NDP-sugar pyrophosphorylase family protein